MDLWIQIWWGITTLICAVGIYLGMLRVVRYSGDDSVIAKRIVRVVFSDILIYGITAFFGLAAACGVDLDGILYPFRALFFFVNVYFSYRLLQPL